MKSINMPRYFVIKYTGSLLWWKYIAWLNKTYDCSLFGDGMHYYYGYDDNVDCHPEIGDFKNNPVVLTLEQWSKYQKLNFEIY